MNTIKAGEAFTIQQVLDSNGFTLDTSEFTDLLDNEEEFDYSHCVKLNNEEMLRLLNIDDENDDKPCNDSGRSTFIGLSFDELRKKMTNVDKDGQVMKLIKKEGVGEIVPPDAQVTVEYVGYFEYQDEPFDSTLFHKDKHIVTHLGKGSIIPGLRIGISSMKKLEKSLFLIKPSLAYGKLGCPPRIPPNSEVLFKVELLNFLDNGSADTYDDLDDESKKKFPAIEKIVRDLMNTAMDSFKRQKIKQAIREYNKAVIYLEQVGLENDEEEANMNKLLSRALTNLTVCYNKINKPKLACANFIRLPTKSGKAYFQYGKALAQLGEYDDAMKALHKAYQMTAANDEIQNEIQRIDKERQKYLEFSKRFARKSLQMTETVKNNEFEEIATEMCETFLADTNLLKQKIPNGLSVEEQECIRRVAAIHGLSIIKQNRFNVETSYISKSSYYSRNMT